MAGNGNNGVPPICGDSKEMPWEYMNNSNSYNSELIKKTVERVRGALVNILPTKEEEGILVLLSGTGVTLEGGPDIRSHTEENYKRVQEKIQEGLY